MFSRMGLLLPGAITLCLAWTEALGVNKHLKVIAMEQPPFTLTRLDGSWVGIEVRFLDILSKSLNFTFDVTTAGTTLAAPTATWTSSDAAVVVELAAGVADLGIGGVHLTPETEFADADVRSVYPHSQDCGAFVTQASVALPRHRAIMGPFHWKVWLALTVAYIFGAIPLAILSSTSRYFSNLQPRSAVPSAANRAEIDESWLDRIGRTVRSTLRTIKWIVRKTVFVLLRLHDAFWDIFGTFTNAFTLSKGWRSIGVKVEALKEEMEEEERASSGLWRSRRGSQWIRRTPDSARRESRISWVSSLQDMFLSVIVGTEGLRLLVAFYWAFTVIVSALYTGSIIAFITLPVFPKPYDTGEELLNAGYTWGTLATGDWPQWLRETDSPVGEQVRRLTAKAESYGCGCRGMRLFPTAERGIRAVEYSSSLAFLSSRTLLQYLIAHPASSHDEEEEEEESLFSFNLLRKVVGRKRRGPILAISTECFVPFRVGFLARGGAEGTLISEALKQGLLRAEEAGLLEKARQDADQEVGEGEELEVNVKGDVVTSSEKRWRSEHGNRLLMGGGFRLGRGVLTERVLSLDDVQGIFLLLGAGFSIAFFALFMEIFASRMKKKYCPDIIIKSDTEDSEWDVGFSDDDDEDRESLLIRQLEGSDWRDEEGPRGTNHVVIKSQSRISAPEIGVTLEESLRGLRTPRRAVSACTYRHHEWNFQR